MTSLIVLHCRTSHDATSQKTYDSIYIDQFKLTYFRHLLLKGFNNSEAAQSIISFDKSGFTEPILTEEDLNLIDSLTTMDNVKMQIDSTNSIGRKAEGAQGKHALGYTLNKIESKWLDSLAQKRCVMSGIKNLYKVK